jgi:phosphonate transport system ATP-binding protein
LKPASAGFRLSGVTAAYNGYGVALSGVDLEIAPGEAVGVVGPSGSGKTTLLRLLGAVLDPVAGSVLIGDADPGTLTSAERRALRAHIGTIHQDPSLVPSLRVARNVLAGRLGSWSLLSSLRHMAWPSRVELSEVHARLERGGSAEKLVEGADRLSGGQRQRVAIARALFQEPSALLADEPVASVDPARARDLLALLLKLSHDAGITLCVSLHHLALAREFLPRLVGLRHGRVVFDRPTDELHDADFEALYDLTPEELVEDG